MREERKLTKTLETFDLKDAECHLAADRVFVSLAIARWYGSEEAFTEYVRGPLRKELLAASGLDLPLSYVLLIVTSPLCMILDLVVALIRAGAPVNAALAQFIAAGFGSAFFWNMVCIKVMWNLCSRWASPGPTRLFDYLVSLAIFLIFVLLVAAHGVFVNAYLLKTSLAASIAHGIVACVLAIVAYSSFGGCQGRSFGKIQ